MGVPVTVPLGPAVANLTGIRAGDRNLITATVTSKGAPIDLTGMTLSAQARAKSTDAAAAMTAEVTVLDAATGQISIRWPGDQVTTALAGAATWKGVWDLQLEQAGQDPLTIVAGGIAAEMDVTRVTP